MKINIITIGNFKSNDSYKELFDKYKKRIRCEINLIELKTKQQNSIEEQKKFEADLLLKTRNTNNKLIVLDERGKIISTIDFQNLINKFKIDGDIDIIIGGSDGLTEEVRKQADFVMSFGKMVFPHLMVRVMIIEQLYRVYTLNNGHPYHK